MPNGLSFRQSIKSPSIFDPPPIFSIQKISNTTVLTCNEQPRIIFPLRGSANNHSDRRKISIEPPTFTSTVECNKDVEVTHDWFVYLIVAGLRDIFVNGDHRKARRSKCWWEGKLSLSSTADH